MTAPSTPALTIAGSGSHRIWVRLEPVSHVSSAHPRGGWADAFNAVTLTGADFNGDHDRGLSRFEARVYAPPGFEDSDRDRCMLASFEFHHIVLDHAGGGAMDFTGVLVDALAYPQHVYDRIAAGTLLTEIEEAAGRWPGDIRYQPVPHAELQPFLGWRAKVTVAPLKESHQEG
ncbi:hypothetical protein [Arthrobacter sp. UYCo732]|uniref:hypothetical protein n=1 Tax=Arthrobacter sp. UYCo732 TaxID=3156336 RepID=UPI0033990737